MEVEILNLTKQSINKKELSILVKEISRQLKLKGDLSLVLVGKQRMRTLNLKTRKIDKATDILTFNYSTNNHLNAEIFINLDDCQKMFKYKGLFTKGDNKKDILNNLLIHGLLHLKGYDDKTEQNRLNMLQLGDKLYEKFLKTDR